MFHCPFCRHAAHSRTSSYLSENVKRRYHQCRNIECSATFRTTESVDGVIRAGVLVPSPEPDSPPAP
ncbi:hypothetical protein C2U55_27110 [Enterobacteriaceae bacterium ENNIH3]|nr:hypothetical protein C2U55_27110 [Enterobacteriaceae bacterium ENNIH3]AUV07490.1 hypothetical protein C2U52_15000 [Enterobacteriaceae bacterium ENNIH2]PWF54066.1 hypothetical protein BHT19_0025535 [[Kluyvera] intestini]